MRLFITGASGFVGGAIAQHLSAKHTLLAMARSDASAEKVRKRGAEPVRCSLDDVTADHLAGCDAVIHAAAFVEAWGTRDDFQRANVDGTRRLLNAARDAGVRRFVHIGTEACLFRGQPMTNIDETYPYADDSPFYYSATKAAAERLVLEAGDAERFQTVSVRPRMVWGPGDQTILPEVLRMMEAGGFAWVNQGRALTSTTHIANLVHGIELALESHHSGEAWFITDGAPVTFRKFLTDLVATQGVVPPDRSVPAFILKPLAWTVEAVWRLFRIRSAPPLTRFAAALMCVDCTIRIDKARDQLGYEPVITLEEGMAELAEQSGSKNSAASDQV